MEFLGIGYQEIALVLVLLLVVVGPERLPTMAYQIGRAVRTLQKYARVVRDEFQEEFDYIDEQYRVVRGEIDQTRAGIREEQARMEREWSQSQASLEADLSPALPPPAPASSNGTEPAAPEALASPDPEPPRPAGPPLVF